MSKDTERNAYYLACIKLHWISSKANQSYQFTIQNMADLVRIEAKWPRTQNEATINITE